MSSHVRMQVGRTHTRQAASPPPRRDPDDVLEGLARDEIRDAESRRDAKRAEYHATYRTYEEMKVCDL